MNCLRYCSINQVFDFCTRVTWSHLREDFGVNQVAAGDFVQIKLKNFLSAVDVRPWDMDFLVESSRSGCSGVQCVVMVGSTNDADVVIFLEAVHLG